MCVIECQTVWWIVRVSAQMCSMATTIDAFVTVQQTVRQKDCWNLLRPLACDAVSTLASTLLLWVQWLCVESIIQ